MQQQRHAAAGIAGGQSLAVVWIVADVAWKEERTVRMVKG
jgi:hypothetical protein